jgi:hypothetical protein
MVMTLLPTPLAIKPHVRTLCDIALRVNSSLINGNLDSVRYIFLADKKTNGVRSAGQDSSPDITPQASHSGDFGAHLGIFLLSELGVGEASEVGAVGGDVEGSEDALAAVTWSWRLGARYVAWRWWFAESRWLGISVCVGGPVARDRRCCSSGCKSGSVQNPGNQYGHDPDNDNAILAHYQHREGSVVKPLHPNAGFQSIG